MQWRQRDGPFQMTSLGSLLLAYTEVPPFQIYPENLDMNCGFCFQRMVSFEQGVNERQKITIYVQMDT